MTARGSQGFPGAEYSGPNQVSLFYGVPQGCIYRTAQIPNGGEPSHQGSLCKPYGLVSIIIKIQREAFHILLGVGFSGQMGMHIH